MRNRNKERIVNVAGSQAARVASRRQEASRPWSGHTLQCQGLRYAAACYAERPLLVLLHHGREAHHIGGQDAARRRVAILDGPLCASPRCNAQAEFEGRMLPPDAIRSEIGRRLKDNRTRWLEHSLNPAQCDTDIRSRGRAIQPLWAPVFDLRRNGSGCTTFALSFLDALHLRIPGSWYRVLRVPLSLRDLPRAVDQYTRDGRLPA